VAGAHRRRSVDKVEDFDPTSSRKSVASGGRSNRGSSPTARSGFRPGEEKIAWVSDVLAAGSDGDNVALDGMMIDGLLGLEQP
jgi:hypothetical protein